MSPRPHVLHTCVDGPLHSHFLYSTKPQYCNLTLIPYLIQFTFPLLRLFQSITKSFQAYFLCLLIPSVMFPAFASAAGYASQQMETLNISNILTYKSKVASSYLHGLLQNKGGGLVMLCKRSSPALVFLDPTVSFLLLHPVS